MKKHNVLELALLSCNSSDKEIKDSPKSFQLSFILFGGASQALKKLKKKILPATISFDILYYFSTEIFKNPKIAEVEQTHSNAMSKFIYDLPVRMEKKNGGF